MRKLTFSVIGLLALFAPSGSRAQDFWEQVGGPFSNNNILAVASGAAGSAFVVTSDGSVFESLGGNTPWSVCATGSFTAIGANRAGMILLATKGLNKPYTGVLSLDNGNTWKVAGQPLSGNDTQITSIAYTPSGRIIEAANPAWIGISADTGTTWNSMTGDLMDSLPRVSETNALAVTPLGHVFVGTDQGVYLSTNNGQHWHFCGVMSGVFSLTLAPNGHLFAGCDDNEIFRSTDEGVSWTTISSSFPHYGDYRSVTIDSNGQLYSGGSKGVFRSTNEGDSWTPCSTGLPDSDLFSMTVASSGVIFASSLAHGCFRSSNGGDSWEAFNRGLTNRLVWAFAFDSSGTMFAGTSSGLFQSSDDAENWTYIDFQGSRINCVISPSPVDILASEYIYSPGIIHSTDDGHTWLAASPSDLGFNDEINAVSMDTSGTVFVSTDIGIFSSANSGVSWTKISEAALFPFAASPSGGLFGVNGGTAGVLYSSDSGVTWSIEDSSGGVYPTWAISTIAFNTRGDVFVGAGVSYGGVFRSTNNGTTWSKINNGLVGGIPNSMVVNKIGVIFTSTDSGVFRSYDNGDTWERIMSGLTAHTFGQLALKNDGTLFVATELGIFRSTGSTLDVRESKANSPTYIELNQNSPNPFTQITTISFSLNEPSLITLKLFNPLGSEVAALANGFFDAGEHYITFDRGDLPYGVYFYRLEAGGESLARSFVVMR